jgi:hypothetical protein
MSEQLTQEQLDWLNDQIPVGTGQGAGGTPNFTQDDAD